MPRFGKRKMSDQLRVLEVKDVVGVGTLQLISLNKNLNASVRECTA